MPDLELTPFLGIVFRVDAGLNGPVMKIGELLALQADELGCFKGKAVVRMLAFGSED